MERRLLDIAKGSGAYLLSALSGSGATFVMALFISWYLGKDGLGILSTALTFVMLGTLLSDLGINSFIVREFAAGFTRPVVSPGTLLAFRILVSSVVAALMVLTVTLLTPVGGFAGALNASALLIVLKSANGIFENYLKARSKSSTFLMIGIASNLLQAFLVYWVLASGSGVSDALTALAGAELAKGVALAWVTRGALIDGGYRDGILPRKMKPVLVQSLPFAVMAVFSLLSDRADIFLLLAYRGTAAAGLYSAADRFLMIGNMVDFSLLASALPVFSSLASTGALHDLTRRTMIVLAAMSLFGSALLWVAAPWLVGITFRFPESVPLLRIMALALPAMTANSILRISLFAAHQERPVAAVFAVACIFNLGMNALFIPRYGVAATCVIAVLTEYGVTAMSAILYSRGILRNSYLSLRQLPGVAQ